ncbi:MAG: ABC transporter ATP-binding protein [Sphaerochaetaceae bacterium]|jgi:ABC-type multidrug transport system fused ATPase/permease subunit
MRSNETSGAAFAFRIAFASYPSACFLMLAAGLMECALASIGIFLTRDLFEAISMIASRSARLSQHVSLFMLYGTWLVASASASFLFNRFIVQFRLLPEFERRMLSKLHDKAQRIPNEALQSPSALLLIRQARASRQVVFRYAQICISILVGALQAIAVTASASVFSPWFILFLPLALLPAFIEGFQESKLIKKDLMMIAQCRKEESEYEKSLFDESASKETRACGLTGLLLQKWGLSREKRYETEKAHNRMRSRIKLLLMPLQVLGSSAGILLGILLLAKGRIDFASFTACVTAFSSIVASYRQVLQMSVNQRQYLIMLKPFLDYWNLEERKQDLQDCEISSAVTIQDVSFSYPGQCSFALRNINLEIPKGLIMAIVGANGSGKTTLAQIALGLFQPTAGAVFFGQHCASDLGERNIHRNQSIVSQDYCKYRLSVEDNIRLGDIRSDKPIEEADIQQMLGIYIAKETLLGKQLGGTDLSQGQWQRLSCARGFYKDADFMVLDEPTSSIDPFEEKRLLDRFSQALKGRTGIIITHRLAMARLADRIVVLQEGQMVECGTHEELLSQKGLYSRMWTNQAGLYD